MYLFKRFKDLNHFLNGARLENAAIGFVPTMGALHEGHLSLVRLAAETCPVVVVSIFVNPTQFNEKDDLEKYPRTEASDMLKLADMPGKIVVFLPEVDEVYPENLPPPPDFDFGRMTQIMEGAFRPGHFEGVVQVVHRLLELVGPDVLVMGQKDFQQQALIRRMLDFMESPVRLVVGPIVREPDGLAMSSRNVRLSPTDRERARLISRTLFEAKEEFRQFSILELKKRALKKLSQPGMKINYFEVVDAYTVLPIEEYTHVESAVICTTVDVGGTRLLDNIILY